MENRPLKRRFLPSTAAAVLTGAWMPVFEHLGGMLDGNGWAQVGWGVVGFVIPVFFATVDRDYLRKKGSFFRPAWSREDLREFYLPAWKRLIVCFLATIVSFGVIAGVKLLAGIPA
jgi:hypothetical protein